MGAEGLGPKASFAQMFAFALMLSIGVSLLTFPVYVRRVGFLWTYGATIWTCGAMIWSMLALVRVKRTCDAQGRTIRTFQDFGLEMGGSIGRRYVEFAIIGFQFLVLCVYLNFISDTLVEMYPSLWNAGIWLSILFIPMCLLACLRYLRDLGSMAQLASGLYVLGWFFVVVYCCVRAVNTRVHNKKLEPRRYNWSILGLYEALLYAFEGIPAALPQIVDALTDGPQAADMLVTWSLVTITFLYIVTETVGVLAFEHPDDPLTFSLISTSGRNLFTLSVNFFVAIAVALKYPMIFFPMISLLERNLCIGPGAGLGVVCCSAPPSQLIDQDNAEGSQTSVDYQKPPPLVLGVPASDSSIGTKEFSAESQPLLDQDVDNDTTNLFIQPFEDGGLVIVIRIAIVALSTVLALHLTLTFLIEIAGAVFAPVLGLIVPTYLDLKLTFTPGNAHDRTKFQIAISVTVLLVSAVLSVAGIVSLFFAHGQPS